MSDDQTPPAPGAPLSPADSRTWATLAHLGGILFGFLAPLVVWAIYRDRDEFVRDQSTEALNFQLTLLIGYLASYILTAVLIGLLTGPLVWVVSLVFSVIGGVAANQGQRYRYPFAMRLIK